MRTVLVVVALAVVVAACDGADKTERTTPGPTRTPAALTTPTAEVRRSGIAEVDAVIAAVESGDIDALLSSVHFTKVPCTSTPPPVAVEYIHCPTGRPDGSLADAFLLAACEGTSMVNAESPAMDLRRSLSAVDRQVYAAYRVGESYPAPDVPDVDFAVVFTYDLNGELAGLALLVNNEGLVGIDVDCGSAPEQLVANVAAEDFVLPPP